MPIYFPSKFPQTKGKITYNSKITFTTCRPKIKLYYSNQTNHKLLQPKDSVV